MLTATAPGLWTLPPCSEPVAGSAGASPCPAANHNLSPDGSPPQGHFEDELIHHKGDL